jgi:hypothetical protein
MRKPKTVARGLDAARPQRPRWHTWLRFAVVTFMCAAVAALFAPYNLLLPVVTVRLVVGLCAGLWNRRPGWAAVSGALANIAGSVTVLMVYERNAFVDWVRSDMPKYARQDTTDRPFQFILDTVAAHPLTIAQSRGQGLALALLLTVLTAGVAATVAWWRLRGDSSTRTALAAWMAAGLLASCFSYTAWVGSTEFRALIAVEPPDRSYSFDPGFNLKTYHMMRRGVGFYDAYVYSISKDARQTDPAHFVDGKLAIWSPMMLRQPAAFFLWRIVGARSADAILGLSIAACAMILLASFGVMKRYASNRALFVTVMLYPSLLLHTTWLNIFFPDWWAALSVLASVFLLLGRKYWAAGLVAFLAILFRSTAGAWMLVLIVGAILLWRRGQPGWRSMAIGYGAGLVGAMGAFGLHYQSAKPYFAQSVLAKPFNLVDLLVPNAMAGIDWKVMSATSYLMQPYGLFLFPTVLMLPAASLGFWLALPRGTAKRFALTAYPSMMLAYYLTIGATSSYWGQLVMPVGIIGTALLVARADMLVARLVSAAARAYRLRQATDLGAESGDWAGPEGGVASHVLRQATLALPASAAGPVHVPVST